MNTKLICLLSIFIGVLAQISNVNAEYENVPSKIKEKYLPHIDCALERKSCDFIGGEVKKLLPVWFENKCADCSILIKSEIKKVLPEIQKYFPDDWKLIEQKYGGKSTAERVFPKFSAPSRPNSQNDEKKNNRPKFMAPSKPPTQEIQARKIQSVYDSTDIFDQAFPRQQDKASFGAKSVMCLIYRKNCDEKTKFFKKSMYLFATINTCPGCNVPHVFEYFTKVKCFLEKSYPRVLQDIIVNKGE